MINATMMALHTGMTLLGVALEGIRDGHGEHGVDHQEQEEDYHHEQRPRPDTDDVAGQSAD